MNTQQASALRHEQEMLNQAQDAGIKLTDTQRGTIHSLSEQMAAAEESTRRLTEVYNFGKEVTGSFFSDLKKNLADGQGLWSSFADAAANALDRIADKALSMAADGIWDLIFGAIGSAITGGFSAVGQGVASAMNKIGPLPTKALGAGWANGGYTGSLSANRIAGVVHGGEYVFSAKATKRLGVGNLDRMHNRAKGYASGGFVTGMPANQNNANDNGGFQWNGDIVVNAPGASASDAKAIAAEVRKEFVGMLNERFPDAVQAVQRNPRARGKRLFG